MKRPHTTRSFIHSLVFTEKRKNNFLNYTTCCRCVSPRVLCVILSVERALCMNSIPFSRGGTFAGRGNRQKGKSASRILFKEWNLLLLSLGLGNGVELCSLICMYKLRGAFSGGTVYLLIKMQEKV